MCANVSYRVKPQTMRLSDPFHKAMLFRILMTFSFNLFIISSILNGRTWSNILCTLSHFSDTLAGCCRLAGAFIWNKLQNVLILSLSPSNSFSTFPLLCFSKGMTLHAFLIKTDNLMAEWALISTLLAFKLDLHCHTELFGIQYKTLFLSLFFPPLFSTTNRWEIIVKVLKWFPNDCLLVQYNFFLSPGPSSALFWGPVTPPASTAHTQQTHSKCVGLSSPLSRGT